MLFEAPLFKRLARNDTGQAVGHQAGFLVPKDLGPYFPELPEPTALKPTPSIGIRVILIDDTQAVGSVESVYQYQSWGGTRMPERRVTANLKPILGAAKGGDLLLIERSLEDNETYRFTLVPQDSERFPQVNSLTNGKGWGVLNGHLPPVTQTQIEQQEVGIKALVQGPLNLFEPGAAVQAVMRVARSRAFKSVVQKAYGGRCAMCGGGLINLHGRSEVEAAHIVGRGAMGADDIRNGLALCRSHHWAFDQGMISIDADRRIRINPDALLRPENASLSEIDGKTLSPPVRPEYTADLKALAWHRKHVCSLD